VVTAVEGHGLRSGIEGGRDLLGRRTMKTGV
jgi:hypothetical protein